MTCQLHTNGLSPLMPSTSVFDTSPSTLEALAGSSSPRGCKSSITSDSILPTESTPRTTGTATSTATSGNCPNIYRGGSKRKYQQTDEIDQILREAKTTGGDTARWSVVASRVGWPLKAVLRRAQELKLHKPVKCSDWTAQEQQCVGTMAREGARDEEIQAALWKDFKVRRTIGAVKTLRQKIGMVYQGADLSAALSSRLRKFWPTPEIDAAIRQAFAAKYEGGGAIEKAKQATGWPTNPVIRRARELGLTKPRGDGLPWTEAEESLLAEYSYQSPQTIQIHLRQRLGIHRTLSSIECKRGRLKLMKNMDGLNLKQLSEALGVAKRTVNRWLAGGWIRGILRFPELQAVNGHVWFFPNDEIRRFVAEHLDSIDLGMVEKYWFVDLLTGRKVGNR
jgi:transcriptional regulator with XRE-family HTH domain